MLRKLLLAFTVALLTLGAAGAAFGGIAGTTLPTIPPPSSLPQGVLAYEVPSAPTSALFYVVVGNRVLTGRSHPSALHTGGAVVVKDEWDVGFACSGAYGYIAKPALMPAKTDGSAHFECSDGTRFEATYHSLSDDAGVGRGASDGGLVSLCYGFPPRAAARHLVAPRGYILVVEHNQLSLRPSGA